MSSPDDEIRGTVNRLVDTLRDRLESDLRASQDELIRIAQEATSRISAEGDEQRARLTREIEDLQRRLSDSESQLEIAGIDLETTRRDVEAARQETDAARRDAESARADSQTAARDLEGTRDDLEAKRQELVAALRDLQSVRRDSDALCADVSRLTDALAEKTQRIEQATRLPEAIRALDAAGTFGEVLENLAAYAGREAGRAAVFLVRGERLRDWRTVGFDFASDAPRTEIGMDDSGPMAEAVRSGAGVPPRSGHELPAFARIDTQGNGDNRAAAAWPVTVGGSVVAVLYADGSVADKPDEAYWPVFLDILARHAGRVLEGITVRQAAGLMTGRPPAVAHASPSGSIQ